LEFVDGSCPDLLFYFELGFQLFFVVLLGLIFLAELFILELLKVLLLVQHLLRLVQNLQPLLEECVLVLIILLLRIGNPQSGLLIPKLPSFPDDCDVCGWVNLFKGVSEL